MTRGMGDPLGLGSIYGSPNRAQSNAPQLVPVTNTGVTWFVNAKGELVQSLPMFTAAVMKSELEC